MESPTAYNGSMDDFPRSVGVDVAEKKDNTAAKRRRQRSWLQLADDLSVMSRSLVTFLYDVGSEEARHPSLCEGWTVRDVIVHLMDGDMLALESLRGGDPFKEKSSEDQYLLNLAQVRLTRHANMGFDEAVDRLWSVRSRLLAEVAEFSPSDAYEKIDWVATKMSRFSLVTSRLMETWIHSYDVRKPLGFLHTFNDRCWWLVDLSIRTLPYALRKSGVSLPSINATFDLSGPSGGSWSQELLLGGGDASEEVTIRGPGWAWALVACRREPGRSQARASLEVLGGRDADKVVDVARAYA